MWKRLLGVLLLCCLLVPVGAQAELFLGTESPAEWAEKDIMRLTQLDTNRSDCLLLECGGQSMLIDGGYPAFRFFVAAYLRESGHEHLDYILNTHPHDDHIATTIELVKNGFSADLFLSPFEKEYNDSYQKRMVRALDAAGIPYQQVHEGDTVTMGGATIEIHTMGQAKDVNQRSAMLKISFGDSTALLCADIPFVTMEAYLAQLGADYLKADICKAPHHGIGYFSQDFLAAVNPALVTVPNNKSQDNGKVTGQCRKRGIPCLLSGEGTLVMETDGTDWYVWQLPQRVVSSY